MISEAPRDAEEEGEYHSDGEVEETPVPTNVKHTMALNSFRQDTKATAQRRASLLPQNTAAQKSTAAGTKKSTASASVQ